MDETKEQLAVLERKMMRLTNLLSELLGDVGMDDADRSYYQQWLSRIARDVPDGTDE